MHRQGTPQPPCRLTHPFQPVATIDTPYDTAAVLHLPAARGQGLTSLLGEPGSDLSTVLGVDFNEAVTGSAATVTLDVLGPCGDCKVRMGGSSAHAHQKQRRQQQQTGKQS